MVSPPERLPGRVPVQGVRARTMATISRIAEGVPFHARPAAIGASDGERKVDEDDDAWSVHARRTKRPERPRPGAQHVHLPKSP